MTLNSSDDAKYGTGFSFIITDNAATKFESCPE